MQSNIVEQILPHVSQTDVFTEASRGAMGNVKHLEALLLSHSYFFHRSMLLNIQTRPLGTKNDHAYSNKQYKTSW